ncbi:putative multidrug resistance protein EmrY [compost metagenome]
MQRNSVFKAWVPDWVVKATLIFCLTPSMMLLGLYNSNVTYAASYLDVQLEDMQFAMNITYGVLMATIIIENRLFRYFSTRNYLIGIYISIAIVLCLSAYTHNFFQFILLRIADGILMALPGIPLRSLLLSRFKSKDAIIIVYSFFYGLLLISSTLTMNIIVWMLDNFSWAYMAYTAALCQLLALGLILLTFNDERHVRKFPLYQIDWSSYILLLTITISGTYFFVYGEKKYWFQSTEIVIAGIVTLIGSALFILKQLNMKRPAFDLNVFKVADLRIGLGVFLIFYLSRSTLNICHSTMNRIWNWEQIHVVHVQYINVAGIITGLVISGIALARKLPLRFNLMFGFALLVVYHLWFTFLFVPDVSLQQIAIPYFLQGMGVGSIFIPLVLFTLSAVPDAQIVSGGLIAVLGRFGGTVLGFSFLQNAQVILQRKHYLKMQQFVSPESMNTQDRLTQLTQSFQLKGYSVDQSYQLAIKQLDTAIAKQSFLLTNMEIYTFVGIALIAVVILLMFNQHLKESMNLFKKRWWGFVLR